jgi:hypothetical protein
MENSSPQTKASTRTLLPSMLRKETLVYSPVTKRSPDSNCFKNTTRLPLKWPASKMSMVPGEMLGLNQNKTQLNHVKRPAAFSDCLVQKHFLLKRESILRKLLLFEQRLPKTKAIAFNQHETMWYQISYPCNTMCISHPSLAPQSCQKTSSIFRVSCTKTFFW